MCGIAGIYSTGKRIEQSVLSEMTEALIHRGPDDSGFFVDAQSNVGLGHTRLSIIDLSERGKQPMSNSDGTITVSYNGEIYNYREIRKELEGKGHSLMSDSDTEVVVKSYEQWGMQCLHKFIGMFALAIWDARKKTLFLARDRAGVKPLYYYRKNGLFLFASELKSIMKHPAFPKRIDSDGLALFLRYDYIKSPGTILQDTFKLEPGHWMSVKNGEIKKHRYWNIADYYNMTPHSGSEEEITEELERILVDSFKYRLVSDVPVGLFLSGGIDSSIVAALLQRNVSEPIKTFTIGFDSTKHNEAHHAKKIAEHLGTDHTEHYISEDEALEIVPQLPDIYDEPFADNSTIPTLLVSQIARRDVKVALSADGGDELFCGYNHYTSYLKIADKSLRIPGLLRNLICAGLNALNAERFERAVNMTGVDRIKRLRRGYVKRRGAFLLMNKGDMAGMFKYSIGTWLDEEIDGILNHTGKFNDNTFSEQFEEVEKRDLMSQMLAADFAVWLPDDILTKVDRATMSVGLESREPLLDHRLMEFTARIPSEYKYRNGESKYILKKVLEKHLPRELFDRKKMGFGSPIDSWMRGKLLPLVQDYLSEESLKRENIFNPATVSEWMDKFYKHSFDGKRIWNLLVFQMWKEKWL